MSLHGFERSTDFGAAATHPQRRAPGMLKRAGQCLLFYLLLVHLGAMARGGAALVMTEATAVLPEGRISPEDTGLWSDELAAAWAPIVEFVRGQGAAIGVASPGIAQPQSG